MRYRFAFSAFFAFALQSCQTNLSNEDITASVWKCGVPCGLSDILIFDKNTTIRNDTIFYHTAPYGKIVKRISDFDEDTKISVINLRDLYAKDTCIYHAK